MDRWAGIDEFVAVAQMESFSGAAKRLGVATSHVSRQIARLEERVQTRLFHRTTRQVSLTEAGRVFHARALRMVDDCEDAMLAISDQAVDLKGHLRMTCSVAYGELFVVPLINEFLLTHPQVSIEVELTNRLVDLVGEGFDFAIRIGKLSDSQLVAVRLAERVRYLCASPDYLERAGTPKTIDDLAGHSCLTGPGDHWELQEGAQQRTFRPSGRWRSNSAHATLTAALQGLGICQLPHFYFDEHLKTGALVSLLDACRPADEGVWAVYPHRRHLSRKVRNLIDHLRTGLHRGAVAELVSRSSWLSATAA